MYGDVIIVNHCVASVVARTNTARYLVLKVVYCDYMSLTIVAPSSRIYHTQLYIEVAYIITGCVRSYTGVDMNRCQL